ncbi:MAG: metal ABC transporter ATP-binding protein [Actinomyces sp.]|uniref:metal ABC transporter ATP-binding protein n=1 Tax=Actinomyces sp. TaxID=29317 RepID=UPI0026DC0BC2|nr:metal ABC transporter ATP-binding protein [Actinomyces sp.]MDO4243037.1 metal ABC transporter ATP-binding protein [Actinomyces sp.]
MSAPGPDVLGQEVIGVQDASVVLGSDLVLDAVDLRVGGGESVALLGANGSGKSTLVRTVLGLHPLRSGRVRLFGHDVARRRRVPWGRVGYVPQRVSASSGVPATALEVVRSGLLSPTRPWADRGPRARRRAMEALEAVGLAQRAGDHVQVFSGGQSQRVLIARALVRDPELLVLDEPLAGIDRASREALATILGSLRDRGVTLVTVLHEMGELAEVVERAVVLEDGRVVSEGPAAELAAAHGDHGQDAHPHDGTRPAHHAPTLTAPTYRHGGAHS